MTRELTGHTPDKSDVMEAMIAMLRALLRDWEVIHELLDGEESKDRDLALAIFRCIEDFNGTSPLTSYSLPDLVSLRQTDLILQGSACNVVQSVYFPHLRNEVQFSDAGINVQVQGKHQGFLQWYQMVKNEYEQKKRSAKIAFNQEGLLSASVGMSGIPSEFWDLYNYYREL